MSIENAKRIITRLTWQEETLTVSALFEDDRIAELNCFRDSQTEILGNIYIGKVKNVQKNISAAFLNVQEDITCYYPFEGEQHPILLNRKADGMIRQGDEILVQVKKEAHKTKAAAVTSNLCFTGKYAILTSGNKRLGFSQKLSENQKKRLHDIFITHKTPEYGFIIRTNARDAANEEIEKELEELKADYEKVIRNAQYRTCYSCLWSTIPGYIADLRDNKGLEMIVTDCEDLYTEIEVYIRQEQPELLKKLRRYNDDLLSLSKLYSLESRLSDALKKHVWLKSGGYLVIEPTEALVVIDVNTGKYVGRKNQQQTFLKINKEAANEIAWQLRLRNLSGIIIVDFIDLESKDARSELLEYLELRLKQDPIKTALIGMSPLHLVEITRKKVRKTLAEQVGKQTKKT